MNLNSIKLKVQFLNELIVMFWVGGWLSLAAQNVNIGRVGDETQQSTIY